MSIANKHPSDLVWSQYLAGDLDWWGSRKLRKHLLSCSACQEEHDEMLIERDRFNSAPKRQDEIARLREKLPSREVVLRRPTPTFWGGWTVAIPVAAACAAVFLVIFLVQKPDSQHSSSMSNNLDSQPTLRIKGNDALVIYAEREGHVSVLKDECHSGDKLRARFWTDKKYAFIVGADDAESGLYPMYPMEKTVSRPVTETPTDTPDSWILDDNLGTQRIIAVFSDTPLAFDDLSRKIRLDEPGKTKLSIENAVVSEFVCKKVR